MCFACTGDELFQNRASRVDGRLCFRCGTAGIDPWPVAKPCHRPAELGEPGGLDAPGQTLGGHRAGTGQEKTGLEK